MTHRYIGPTTSAGLGHGAKCRIIGKRAGGRVIAVEDGRTFLVGKPHLEKL